MIDGVPAADRYLFDLEGYLVIEDALDPTQLAAVNDEIDRLLAGADPDATTVSFGAGGGELPASAASSSTSSTTRASPLPGGARRPRRPPRPRVRPRPATRHRRYRLSSAVLHGGGTPFDASQWFRFADGRTWKRAHGRRVPPARRRSRRRRAGDRAGQPQGEPTVPRRVARPRRRPPPERAPRWWAGRHCGRVQRGVDPRDPALARRRRAARHAVLQVQPAPDLLGVALLRPRRARAADRAPSAGCSRRRTAARRAASNAADALERARVDGAHGRRWCPPRPGACPRGSP